MNEHPKFVVAGISGVKGIPSVEYPLGRPVIFAGPTRSGKTARALAPVLALRKDNDPAVCGGFGGRSWVVVEVDGVRYTLDHTFKGPQAKHVWSLTGGDVRLVAIGEIEEWVANNVGLCATFTPATLHALSEAKQRTFLAGLVGSTEGDVGQVAVAHATGTDLGEVGKAVLEWFKGIARTCSRADDPDGSLNAMVERLQDRRKDEVRWLRDATGASSHLVTDLPLDAPVGDVKAVAAEAAEAESAWREAQSEADRAAGAATGYTQAQAALGTLRKELDTLRAAEYPSAERDGEAVESAERAAGKARDRLNGFVQEVAELLEHAHVASEDDLAQAVKAAQRDALASAVTADRVRVDLDRVRAMLEPGLTSCPTCGSDEEKHLSSLRRRAEWRLKSLQEKLDNQAKSEAARDSLAEVLTAVANAKAQATVAKSAALEAKANATRTKRQADEDRKRWQEQQAQAIKRLEGRIAETESATAPPASAGENVLRVTAESARKTFEALSERVKALEAADQIRAQRSGASAKVEASRAWVRAIDALLGIVGPKGLMAQALFGRLSDLVGFASWPLATVRHGDEFAFDRDPWRWGIRRGQLLVPWGALSGSEQTLVGLGLTYAVVQYSRGRLVVFDELDRLGVDDQTDLDRALGWLAEATQPASGSQQSASLEGVTGTLTCSRRTYEGLCERHPGIAWMWTGE